MVVAAAEATAVVHRLWEPELVNIREVVLPEDFPALLRTLQHRPSVELTLEVEVEVDSTGVLPEVDSTVVLPEAVMEIMEAAIRLRTTTADRVVLREVSQTPVPVASLVPVPDQLAVVVTLEDLDQREDRLDLDQEPLDRVVTVEDTPKK